MSNPLTVKIDDDEFRFRLHLLVPSEAPFDMSGLHFHIEAFAKRAHLTQEECHAIRIAIEEMITNIGKFGMSGDRLPASLTATGEVHVGQNEVRLTMADNGTAFDPDASVSPELDVDVCERDVGGLGLYMLRQLFTSHSYARNDGWNINVWVLQRTLSSSVLPSAPSV